MDRDVRVCEDSGFGGNPLYLCSVFTFCCTIFILTQCKLGNIQNVHYLWFCSLVADSDSHFDYKRERTFIMILKNSHLFKNPVQNKKGLKL